MFENWSNVQQEMMLNGKITSNLKNDETCVFYLRAQNCCVIFKRKKGLFTLLSFQASASNKQVMSVDSDLLGIYPTFEVHVEDTN